MQKRARTVDTQKLRRTIKARTRTVDPMRDGMSMSLAYVRLGLLWLSVISLDVLVGFRFELLWPFWLIVRAGFEALHKNGNSFVTLANHNSAKFSVLFVCVTATSDLICYLFIPVRVLIFLASTYVWVNLVWHTNGGFIRTLTTILTDRSQGVPIVVLWTLVVLFEASCRMRCDYLVLARDGGPLASYLNMPHGCLQVQGLSPVIPRSLNAFFGAHCIGYPLVIVSFSLRYYFKEWRIRRKQEEVGKKNEVLVKLLTEALPAVYDGPKQYQSRIEQETLEYELSGTAEVPMLMPISNGVSNGTSTGASTSTVSTIPSNSSIRKTSFRQQNSSSRKEKKRGGAKENRTPPDSKKISEDIDELSASITRVSSVSDSGSCWRESNQTHRGIVYIIWNTLTWLTNNLFSIGNDQEDASSYDDEDEDDDSSIGEEVESKLKKHSRYDNKRNGHGGKQKTRHPVRQATTTTQQIQKIEQRQQNPTIHQIEDKPRLPSNGSVPISVPLTNGHAKREESTEKRDIVEKKEKEKTPENNNHSNNTCDVELSRIRLEVQSAKAIEADLRLQLTLQTNAENRAKQEVTQLRSRLEQIQARLAGVEKSRDQERLSLSQLERKYAELANRKNDVEKELLSERRARQEDAGREKNKADVTSEQREKDRRLEAEAERLRIECSAKEDALLCMEKDLHELREYKEKNDVEGLEMELRILREKNAHLEEALAAENKLKQELFRALGDAKANNQHLNNQLDTLRSSSASMMSELSVKTTLSHPMCHQEKGSPSIGHPLAPPPYDPILPNNFMPYSFASQSHPGVSPTGEHLLFEPSASSLPCALSPHDSILASRIGKYGAPSANGPQRSNC